MVKELVHDPLILGRASLEAGREDLQTAQDLMDTLIAHKDGCLGMAANMLGVSQCIIAFENGDEYMLMYNPEIIKCSQPYMAEEGCLSLDGRRQTKRYKSIKVEYETLKLERRVRTYTGYTAQIIQHEIDHTNGILI